MKRALIFAFTAALIFFSAVLGRTAPAKKTAYLTFDDGPTLNTPAIMDTLKKHNAGATFFVLKDRIELYPDFIKRMEVEGFSIGLHGVTHNGDIYLTPTSPLSEMNSTNDALYRLIGRKSRIVRTPYGSKPNLTARQRELLETAGYRIFDWNVDPRDSIGKVIDKNAVLRELKSGLDRAGSPAVILLHDRKSTADNLEEILCLIESAGYSFETLTENTQY